MTYPTSIKSFSFKRNNIDKVIADDVNSAYTEITEIQRQLGGVVSGGIGVTTSTWGTGTFGTTISNWLSAGRDGLAERLANIEAGLYQVLVTRSLGAITVTSVNGTTIPTSKTLVTTETTSLSSLTSVNGTTIPSSATLLTSTSTASALTSVGTLTNLVIGSSAGSTAPLRLTSGTNLSSAAAGAIEYDGRAVYFTPVTGNRGILPTTHFFSRTSERTLQTGGTATSPQSVFGVGITLAASTSYQFDMQVSISITGTTTVSNNVTSSLTYSGTTTSLSAVAFGGVDDGTLTSKRYLSGSVVLYANTLTTATVTTWRISGIIRTSTSGTFTPQLTLSGSNTNSFLVLNNSFIKLTPIGSNTDTGQGAWA
jgi:hypothetical protein